MRLKSGEVLHYHQNKKINSIKLKKKLILFYLSREDIFWTRGKEFLLFCKEILVFCKENYKNISYLSRYVPGGFMGRHHCAPEKYLAKSGDVYYQCHPGGTWI